MQACLYESLTLVVKALNERELFIYLYLCVCSTLGEHTFFVGNPVKFLGVLCNQLTNFQGFFLLYLLILSLTIVLIGADLHYVALVGLQFFS